MGKQQNVADRHMRVIPALSRGLHEELVHDSLLVAPTQLDGSLFPSWLPEEDEVGIWLMKLSRILCAVMELKSSLIPSTRPLPPCPILLDATPPS